MNQKEKIRVLHARITTLTHAVECAKMYFDNQTVLTPDEDDLHERLEAVLDECSQKIK